MNILLSYLQHAHYIIIIGKSKARPNVKNQSSLAYLNKLLIVSK